MRAELLNPEVFNTLAEARVLIDRAVAQGI
jgi:hypothetical protein